MRKDTLTTLLFTCIAGAFGIFFRWLQLLLSFEEDTGLPIHGSVPAVIVPVFCVLVALGLLILTRRLRRYEARTELNVALHCRSFLFTLIGWIAAALSVIGALALFFSAPADRHPELRRVLAILALLSGLCFPGFIYATGKKPNSLSRLFSLVPVIFCCFWLIVSYKDHIANPVVSSYAIEILAISASILAFFFVAGYPCNSPKPLTTFFFCNVSTFLCLMTLVDVHAFGELLIFASMAVMQLTCSVLISMNLRERD
jgi:hypothetical protein